MEKRKDLLVAALESGTVIDHIPTDKVFTIVQLLQLDKCQDQVTIGNNLESQKFGKKGIIKIANRFFSDAEISQLAVVCPNIRLCLIKDYEVVEKNPSRGHHQFGHRGQSFQGFADRRYRHFQRLRGA